MAAPSNTRHGSQARDSWASADDDSMGPVASTELFHGPPDEYRDGQTPDYEDHPARSINGDNSNSSGQSDSVQQENQTKPNKVYVGGLPGHTRQEDLRSCFGKIGNILNIELKIGYGFVEFDTREAAEESVAKYNDGSFMGKRIRVEISHGGGRAIKHSSDPGACFKCGKTGHWARACRTHPRGHGSPPRDEPAPSRRDVRHGHVYPPLHHSSSHYYRRPVSPLRDYRMAAPIRSGSNHDDYRDRGRPPPSRYEPPGRDLNPPRGRMPSRPMTPPRHADHRRRSMSTGPSSRRRRRSLSPPPRDYSHRVVREHIEVGGGRSRRP